MTSSTGVMKILPSPIFPARPSRVLPEAGCFPPQLGGERVDAPDPFVAVVAVELAEIAEFEPLALELAAVGLLERVVLARPRRELLRRDLLEVGRRRLVI